MYATGDRLVQRLWGECGYEDCNGDPRDGCEIDLNYCQDGDGIIGWEWGSNKPTNGCEIAFGYSADQLDDPDPLNPSYDCTSIAFHQFIQYLQYPVYCRGGQETVQSGPLGTCAFICVDGRQDCDLRPDNTCEAVIGNLSCNCVNCQVYLPGTLDVPKTVGGKPVSNTISQSSCDNTTEPGVARCTIVCDDTLCENLDGDWTNGCEVAKKYPEPRLGGPIGPFDCSIWAKDPCIAKKHHIDLDPTKISQISCEGRPLGNGPGLCSYESACFRIAAGSLHEYQDCNSDPRDGCEDTARWCAKGGSLSGGPFISESDKCSKALIYACGENGRDGEGFDSNDSPCKDPATGLFLDFPAPGRSSVDCWVLYNESDTYFVDISEFVPFCDRNVTHVDTRGDCVFKCVTDRADCDHWAGNGCEANITVDASCDDACINCVVISGAVRNPQPPKCVTDPLRPGHHRCNFTCPSVCSDKDGKWENGCETSTNGDSDLDGVFMNELDDMDCSIMEAEGRKNPYLFRHHLHIDLTKKVPTLLGDLPPGTIFCDNALSKTSGLYTGKCYFMCIDGFINTDQSGYNGCEAITAPAYPHLYGGYWIGDPHVEDFFTFLDLANQAGTYRGHIAFPKNLANFATRETPTNSPYGTYHVPNRDNNNPTEQAYAPNFPLWY